MAVTKLQLEIPEIDISTIKPQIEKTDYFPEIQQKISYDKSALDAFKMQNFDIGRSLSQSAAVSNIVNNYDYSSVTNNQSPENTQEIVLNAQFVVGENIVAEGVLNVLTDEIDERQGLKIQMKKRGLAT